MVQRAQRAQSVQAVSSLSADVSSLLIASCPNHITQSEIGSHTLTRLQPSPMSENRNANALPQAFPFVTESRKRCRLGLCFHQGGVDGYRGAEGECGSVVVEIQQSARSDSS